LDKSIDDSLLTISKLDKKIFKLINNRISIINDNKSLNSYEVNNILIEKLKNNRYKYKNINNEDINTLFNEIINIQNKNNTSNDKIAYLGPQGSYTQEAAENKFGKNAIYCSVNSIKNIFLEVSENRAQYGIVPIENSSNGIVGDTINSFNLFNLTIIGEIILDIHHALVSTCKNINEIKTIYSKDIAFDQCSIFLENYHLNEVKYVYVESTTKAAKIALRTPNSAAICSQNAAKTNNIPILFKNIEDNKNNRTRFFVISNRASSKTKNNKTSIIVQLPNKYGSLITFLNSFKKAKVSLTKIKSHIVNGVSTFFIEFKGHKNDDNIKKLLNKHSKYIKFLGSYPKEVEDI